MTSGEDFVGVLRDAAPRRTALIEAGLGDVEIEQILAIFACPKRGTAPSVKGDELLRTLEEYDLSAAEVSSFRFCSPPEAHARGALVGYLESDSVVRLPDGRLALLDHANAGEMLEICAVSGSHFLAGLEARVLAGLGAQRGSPNLVVLCAERAGVDASSVLWRTVAG